jgi:hypothetical protein
MIVARLAAIAALFVAVLAISGGANAGSPPPIGIWKGTAQQYRSDGSPFSRWTLVMDIERLAPGGSAGTMRYPSLQCAGTLTYLGERGDTYSFTEHITSGGCIDDGVVSIDLVGPTLAQWRWEKPTSGFFAVSEVTEDKPAPHRTSEADGTLLRRYSPILNTHAFDWPTDVVSYLPKTQLEQLQGGAWVAVKTSPTLSDLPFGGSRATFRLNDRDCDPVNAFLDPTCYQLPPDKPTIYGRVTRSSKGTVISFWLFYETDMFYPWDKSQNHGVLQAHEGDWEWIAVGLQGSGKPSWVAISQHARGRWKTWAEAKGGGDLNGTHPVVHVALGSHANYFESGWERVPLSFVDPTLTALCDRVLNVGGCRVWDNALATYRIGAAGSGLHSLSVVELRSDDPPKWISYGGAWGEGNDIFVTTPPDSLREVSHDDAPGGPSGWKWSAPQSAPTQFLHG